MGEHRGKSSRRKAGGGVLLKLLTLAAAAGATAGVCYYIFQPELRMLLPAAASAVNEVLPSGWRSSSAPAGSGTPASSSSQAAPSASSSLSSSSSSTAHTGTYADLKTAVFIGDSITSGISLYDVADTAGVFASNGMSVSSALKTKVSAGNSKLAVEDAVKGAQPDRIYLLLGANDIPWMKEDTFIAYYGKLIDTLRTDIPGAAVYVQSILPVTAGYEASAKVTNGQIDEFNARLSQMCGEKSVRYLNVAEALKGSDGKLPKTYSAGGYNISKSAYTEWFGYLLLHE